MNKTEQFLIEKPVLIKKLNSFLTLLDALDNVKEMEILLNLCNDFFLNYTRPIYYTSIFSDAYYKKLHKIEGRAF